MHTSRAGQASRDGASVDLLFDARHIRQSGIGTYIRTQIPVLERVLGDHRFNLAILADRNAVPDVSAETRVVFADPADARMYSTKEQRAWRRALSVTRPKALWVPHYPFPLALLSPRSRNIQFFVTVHDTLHIEDNKLSDQNRAKNAYARTMLQLSARRARTVFTPSQATARSMVAVAPSAEVLVTPIPVDDVWFSPSESSLSPIQPPYLLYVGNIKRHKNLPLLLDAFAAISSSVPHTLVIAGGDESLRTLDDRVNRLVDSLGDRVQLTGRLPFDRLRALVAQADLLIMPSLYEGAGLPPLEAMASHTAVLSSNIPVLMETCGDGAEYFDPHDSGALAVLMKKYCGDEQARAALSDRGRSHVQRRQSEIPSTATAESICSALRSASL
ncbi:glycosyltransferase family 1 protein [Rhodococcus sp. IEGM 1379]|uniref:glycosyltransferase family 4 protein n=1 Tax=Rhodococcus sp. IEGM 1379 TaxID=3047086 RepID=UPI0024B75FCF|nr:glycosyltransferase family 1 protein [Rhodococcus sp. IEGM 1379]MDI9916912.1 glycosyltransferase family 1 protein [Rhodococcus sp. IEGM 1379]